MPSIDINRNPKSPLLTACFAQIGQDSERHLFLSDTDIYNAQEFLQRSGESIIPFVVMMGESPAALCWLYNVAMLPPKMTFLSAYLKIYVMPDFRAAVLSSPCSERLVEGIHTYGFTYLWAFIHPNNTILPGFLTQCGFISLATLPAWERSAGIWHDADVYRLYTGDDHV